MKIFLIHTGRQDTNNSIDLFCVQKQNHPVDIFLSKYHNSPHHPFIYNRNEVVSISKSRLEEE